MTYYDFHVEIEMPSGYKDAYSAVSLLNETALQVNGMIYHRSQNEIEDFEIKVRVFGNYYDCLKDKVIKEATLKVKAGFNTKADFRKTLKRMFTQLRTQYA